MGCCKYTQHFSAKVHRIFFEALGKMNVCRNKVSQKQDFNSWYLTFFFGRTVHAVKYIKSVNSLILLFAFIIAEVHSLM